MLIKLIELHVHSNRTTTRELYVNTQSIVSITQETRPKALEEARAIGFSPMTQFSTLVINEGYSSRQITVAHSPEEVHKKIRTSKGLLKG